MENNSETAVKQVKKYEDELSNNITTATQEKFNAVKQEISNKAEKLSETTDKFKVKVSENISGVADKVHQKSDETHDYLNKKADKVNDFAHQTIDKANELSHQTIDKANNLSHRAADALNSSSEYVKNFDIAETANQVKISLKRKPELTLTLVGILGLAIGLLIGRRTR